MVAMAGMYLGGISNFASFATGTIMVVAVAVLGSLTVLPATLSKLAASSRRAAFRSSAGSEPRRVGIWSRILDRVLRRPLLSAIVSAGVLVALTIPVLGMETSLGGTDDNSRDIPAMQTYDRIQAAFPSEGSAEMVVIKAMTPLARGRVRHQGPRGRGRRPSGPLRGQAQPRAQLGQDGRHRDAPDHRGRHDDLSNKAVEALREDIVPSTVGKVDGVEAYTTGEAAATGDFNDAMIGHLPYVFAFVLSAAFLLLLVTFARSSFHQGDRAEHAVRSAYGLLTLVFQHGLGESLGLGSGPIAAWPRCSCS